MRQGRGAVDPRVADAPDSIRVHPVNRSGDQAIAVLEQGGAGRGVDADILLLAVPRDHWMAAKRVHGAWSHASPPTFDSLRGLDQRLASRLQQSRRTRAGIRQCGAK
jgi:hypothetical protein